MRESAIPSVEEMELVGGRLCLDFINTANRVQGQCHEDRFTTYGDVLRWSARLGLIERSTANRLAQQAGESPRKAASALKSVHELRERLWRIFAGGQPVEVEKLRTTTRVSMPGLRLNDNATIVLDPGSDLSGWLLIAIFGSAIELLTTVDLTRVKECPGRHCGWLFLDDSPSNRRKWCSMKACGNRQKAQQHYRRSRARARSLANQ